MKIVGHKSEKMRKRYNAIEERDLTQAAQKLNKYLKINIAPEKPRVEGCQAKSLKRKRAPVAQSDRASAF